GRKMLSLAAKRRIEKWNTLEAFPEAAHFLTKAGGWSLLSRCVAMTLSEQAAADSAPGGAAAEMPVLRVDLAQFSEESGASKSTLRRLLESAYAKGYLMRPPLNGREIQLTQQLVCAFTSWVATYFYVHRLCALAPSQF
ncbi:MAG: hypothetical protein ACKOUM_06655, partial [Sphingopyxis sp.]